MLAKIFGFEIGVDFLGIVRLKEIGLTGDESVELGIIIIKNLAIIIQQIGVREIVPGTNLTTNLRISSLSI